MVGVGEMLATSLIGVARTDVDRNVPGEMVVVLIEDMPFTTRRGGGEMVGS